VTRPLPAHPGTARGLIRDTSGCWLIVQPVTNNRWHLPGGLIEQDESPAAACAREIHEELGLNLTPGPLYVAGWNPPRRPGRSARFTFVFDMGSYDADRLASRIALQSSELKDWRWMEPGPALGILHPDMAARLTTARRTPPTAVYAEQP